MTSVADEGDDTVLRGVPAADGLAVGPLFVLRHAEVDERNEIASEDADAELKRFGEAVDEVVARLEQSAETLGGEAAEVFEAHVMLARDPELASGVEAAVRSGDSPERAVREVAATYADALAASDDEYMAARADDVRDVARQLAVAITGGGADATLPSQPSIVVAASLAPSDTARLPRDLVLGYATSDGSPSSHVAIMARSLGVPAVVGLGPGLDELKADAEAVLDGGEGTLQVDPPAGTLEAARTGAAEAVAAREAEREESVNTEATTSDGRRIEVLANLGSPQDAAAAVENGAEGVGLFRTEFLFMERDTLPDEDEQLAAYGKVVEAFAGRPVIIRTLDVGGDKPLPGLVQPAEENPFLGRRGVRLSLEEPDLMVCQLRAILRAAANGHVKVMVPMVVDAEELREVRTLLERAASELDEAGVEHGDAELGAMVETPAAAICAAELAGEAAFLSIGTNDLTQYVLAADRGHSDLPERLRRADHPAVLALVERTCSAAAEAGIPVGVCGEAAGDPELLPTLVGYGVDELSMGPARIPAAKAQIATL